ncbi:MAG: M42 family peptidase [Candidatus Poribacteria bacterium]|nr:M42 family peptidase [Candidatus Poribacteria bacterium]
MTDAQLAELKALCDILAPSGRESAMTAAMVTTFRQYTERVHVDWLGNVTATFGDGDKSLLFAAHMDEIGFVVRFITEGGFLRVERLGGVGRRSALGVPAVVLGEHGELNGTTGLQSHHLTNPAEQFTVPQVEEWYLDIGATSHGDAEALGVKVGTFATFAPNFHTLANGLVCSKTLDNRAACWVLVELARRFEANPPDMTVHLLANVQEEFHLRGLLPEVSRLRPDFAVTLDITPAADTPDLAGRNSVRVGEGVAVKVMDFHGRGSLNGILVPERFVRWFEEIAREADVPTQREVVVGVITDSNYLPSMGIPAAALAIPARYTHSATEVVSTVDVLRTVELCDAAARRGFPPING